MLILHLMTEMSVWGVRSWHFQSFLSFTTSIDVQEVQKEVHAVPEDIENDAEIVNGGGKELPRSKWDILIPLGSIKRQSNNRVSSIKFSANGSLLGCQDAGKVVEIYRVRDESEALKKAKRRKKRKREKATKTGKGETVGEQVLDGDEDMLESEAISASDEFELLQTVRLKQKITSFAFSPGQPKKGTVGTISLALQNNSLEVYDLQEDSSEKVHSIELSGHRSDVRVASLSADSTTLMTASHNAVKIWNPRSGVCLRTVESGYGLCGTIVPGNRQAVLGTKSGGIEIFDIAGAERSQVVEAHAGAVWSLAPMPDGSGFVSGSADHDVKFWEYELLQSADKVCSLPVSTLLIVGRILCFCVGG